MANPLMGMMGGNSPMAAIGQAMRMVNQIRHSGNPQSAINVMAQSNPGIKKAMDMCKGKNPQQVFKQMCQQNGIDPGQFVGMIK